MLFYQLTGLGRKNWRGGFSLLGSERLNQSDCQIARDII